MATRAVTAVPASPYQPGNKFEISAHAPPPPFGANYKNKDPVRTPVHGLVDDRSGRSLVDHMAFVISHPPLDTGAPADTKAQRPRMLTIVQKISHRPKEQGGGTVVVTSHLDADRSTQYVAKIYDGFEYELADPGYQGLDCMCRADMDYSREAAAYESIPVRFQGSTVPQYFGSWTFPLPTGVPGRPRWVRMVLVEYIHGECMLDMILYARGATRSNPEPERPDESRPIDYRLLPPDEERLDVLARIVEAETMIWWYGGVHHGDVAPRNVIISRSGHSNAVSRVALIDFNAAYVLHRCERGRNAIKTLGIGEGLPMSPIENEWPGTSFAYGGKYSGWIPENWCVEDDDGNRDASHIIAAKWLINRWKTSPKFQPPSDYFLNSQNHQGMDEPYPQLVEELKSFVAERRQVSGQQKDQQKGQPRDGKY
ncbi:hypothetical protein C8A00DRAFT_33712 [Chaetomidium leptoderma]|uniref:Uncharacterized protein n=1 Tax=Chaetomidium leptoderma TaxID=669021 RepID=A0AAN6VMK6_9PEZI|nr:hypothetical protein C8A00DRAFT_33712 [Chaetomidium leptoderma]